MVINPTMAQTLFYAYVAKPLSLKVTLEVGVASTYNERRNIRCEKKRDIVSLI